MKLAYLIYKNNKGSFLKLLLMVFLTLLISTLFTSTNYIYNRNYNDFVSESSINNYFIVDDLINMENKKDVKMTKLRKSYGNAINKIELNNGFEYDYVYSYNQYVDENSIPSQIYDYFDWKGTSLVEQGSWPLEKSDVTFNKRAFELLKSHDSSLSVGSTVKITFLSGTQKVYKISGILASFELYNITNHAYDGIYFNHSDVIWNDSYFDMKMLFLNNFESYNYVVDELNEEKINYKYIGNNDINESILSVKHIMNSIFLCCGVPVFLVLLFMSFVILGYFIDQLQRYNEMITNLGERNVLSLNLIVIIILFIMAYLFLLTIGYLFEVIIFKVLNNFFTLFMVSFIDHFFISSAVWAFFVICLVSFYIIKTKKKIKFNA